MTPSTAERGYGAILKKGTGGTAAPIAEITDIGDFGATRDDIDVTSHDSDDGAMEYIAGMIEGGELTVTCNLLSGDTSGQIAAIATDIAAATKSTYTIILSNTGASTFVFSAYVKSYKIKSDLKGAIKVTLTFKISGAPVFTA
ncbi:MAG: phage tail tube protein [Methanoregula sp.]|nr:phage tail tube protein [Methanoregula sp.]MDD5188327.1 phage tail tube protein [Methanoregula sp.]